MGDVPSSDPARIAEGLLAREEAGRRARDPVVFVDARKAFVLARAYLDLREAAQALVAGFDADTPIFTQQVYADLCAALAGGSR